MFFHHKYGFIYHTDYFQEGQIVHYETFLAHENADNEFCYFKQQLDHANSKISQILTNFPEDKKEKMRY